jgi:hypothetical protein
MDKAVAMLARCRRLFGSRTRNAALAALRTLSIYRETFIAGGIPQVAESVMRRSPAIGFEF